MKTSCGNFLNLVHYFPYDVKLRLLAHSRNFLANQKARNAIVGAENLQIASKPYLYSQYWTGTSLYLRLVLASKGQVWSRLYKITELLSYALIGR